MLPWIQVYSNLAEHPKIYALVDRLGLRRNYEAVGIVVSLWLWAAKNAPNGDLSGYSERTIAAAVGISRKKQNELCKSLLETGWLDLDENGALWIHNWSRYAGRLMEIVYKNREQMKIRSRRYRSKRLETQENFHLESEASRSNHALTEQDRTEPNITNSLCPPESPSSSWSKKELFELCQPRLTLSDSALEELLELSQGMEAAVLHRALDIAQDNGKLVWGYVKGILKNWQSAGIGTLAQVEQREQRRREERSSAAAGGSSQQSAQQSEAAARELAEAVRQSRAAMKRMLEEE